MNLITAKEIFQKFNIENNIKDFPKKIYIFHQKGLFKRIQNHFDFKKVDFIRGDLYFEKNNKFAIITNFGAGYSVSLMLAEELSEVGFEIVIGFGIAGFLKKDEEIKIGDLFVIDKSYGQISLSEIYKNNSDFVDNNIFLKNLDKKNSISVISLYEESSDLIERSLIKNISIIDMELYPMALIFKKKNIDFNQVVAISDILENKKWDFDIENIKIAYGNLEKYFLTLES